jgi:hypothetical protein
MFLVAAMQTWAGRLGAAWRGRRDAVHAGRSRAASPHAQPGLQHSEDRAGRAQGGSYRLLDGVTESTHAEAWTAAIATASGHGVQLVNIQFSDFLVQRVHVSLPSCSGRDHPLMHGGTQRHEKPFSAVRGPRDAAHFGEFETLWRQSSGDLMLTRAAMKEAAN